jgi:hypothetical protein
MKAYVVQFDVRREREQPIYAAGRGMVGVSPVQSMAEVEIVLRADEEFVQRLSELMNYGPADLVELLRGGLPVAVAVGPIPPVDLIGRQVADEMLRLDEQDKTKAARLAARAEAQRRGMSSAGGISPLLVGQTRPAPAPPPPAPAAPQKAPLDARMGAIDLGDEPVKP